MTDEEKLKEYEDFHEWLGRRLQSAKDTYDFAGFTNSVFKEHKVLAAKLNAKLKQPPHDCCSRCSDPSCKWLHHAPIKEDV